MSSASALPRPARREQDSRPPRHHRHSAPLAADYSMGSDYAASSTYHQTGSLNHVPRRPCNLDLASSPFDSSKEQMLLLMSQLPSPLPLAYGTNPHSNYTVSNKRRSRASCMFDPSSTYSYSPVSFQDVNGFIPPAPVAPVSSATAFCHQQQPPAQHYHHQHSHHHQPSLHHPSLRQPSLHQQPSQHTQPQTVPPRKLSQRKSFSKLFNSEKEEKLKKSLISAPVLQKKSHARSRSAISDNEHYLSSSSSRSSSSSHSSHSSRSSHSSHSTSSTPSSSSPASPSSPVSSAAQPSIKPYASLPSSTLAKLSLANPTFSSIPEDQLRLFMGLYLQGLYGDFSSWNRIPPTHWVTHFVKGSIDKIAVNSEKVWRSNKGMKPSVALKRFNDLIKNYI